jgi:hypothetical protein
MGQGEGDFCSSPFRKSRSTTPRSASPECPMCDPYIPIRPKRAGSTLPKGRPAPAMTACRRTPASPSGCRRAALTIDGHTCFHTATRTSPRLNGRPAKRVWGEDAAPNPVRELQIDSGLCMPRNARRGAGPVEVAWRGGRRSSQHRCAGRCCSYGKGASRETAAARPQRAFPARRWKRSHTPLR